jgi:hypothetical protein
MMAGSEQVGPDDFEVNPPQLAMDIAPAIGEIMSWLAMESCEDWWRVVIEARSRALSGDADKMPAIQGRA